LKKHGTGLVEQFLSPKEAIEIVKESVVRYEKDYRPKLEA
jgi:hypothetical protein